MTAMRQACTLTVLLLLVSAHGQNPTPTALPVGSATIAELKGDVVWLSLAGEP